MTRGASGTPARRLIPWVAASAAMFSGALSFGLLGAPALFALTRGGPPLAGFVRLWTGHAVHYGAAHLRGDLLAFAAWAALVELHSRRLLVLTLLLGTPLVSLAILALCPEVRQYRGLSALDAALVTELFLARALCDAPVSARPSSLERVVPTRWLRRTAAVGAALFVAKCGFELVTGRALLAPDLGRGVELLVPSHWIGALVGALALVVSNGDARRNLRRYALLAFVKLCSLYERSRLVDDGRNAELFPCSRVLPARRERRGRLRLR